MKALIEAIERAERMVFFGGAGTSTESGIPDFRSESGLYRAKAQYGYPPEVLISRQVLDQEPALFFSYYKENLLYPDAEPHGLHRALVALEKEGKLAGVITQNIDGLHQRAGSRTVVELHGSVHRNTCTGCGASYDLAAFLALPGHVPACSVCGAAVRPDVVLYGESLCERTLQRAVDLLQSADLLIVGGTSLVVYPAAGLLHRYGGKELVLINRSATAFDERATLHYNAPIGAFFDRWMEARHG